MSRARDLSKLGNPNVIKADENSVGFGTQVAGNHANADSSLISAGIITATVFYGDGSNLEGVASAGLGTAVDDTKDSIGQNIYFTNQELSINENTTVNAPDTSSIAYTQYQQVTVESGSELIIADGDSFIPDVLGIGTALQASTAGAGNGLFGTVYADNIENAAGRGGPNFPLGITVAGVSTLSGNVSIGGTLTYEDVTNVDSVGVVTARSGVDINAGGLDITAGGINVTAGVSTFAGAITVGSGGINVTGDSTFAGAINANGLLSLAGGADGTLQELRLAQGNASSKIATIKGHSANTNEKGIQFNTFHYTPKIPIKLASTGAIGLGGDNYGTSGQVLTSQGSGAVAQWADASGGAWEYVSTIANPNTSTVQFTGFTTAYLAYKVYFFGVAVNTNNDRPFRARVFLDNTLKTSGYRYYGPYGDDSGSGTTKQRSDNGDQGMWLGGTSNRGNCAYSGEIYFPMNRVMSGNGGYKTWYARCMSNYTNMLGGGTHDDSQSTQVTGVSFDSPDPYNITNGEFFLYRMPRPV